MRCQFLAHRSLLCSKVDICKEIPHSYWIGPTLLLGWFVTAVGFYLTTR
jgi:hypothetical protein